MEKIKVSIEFDSEDEAMAFSHFMGRIQARNLETLAWRSKGDLPARQALWRISLKKLDKAMAAEGYPSIHNAPYREMQYENA